MEETDIDWGEIQKKYDHSITSKICQFTANEFSSYKSDFPKLLNLPESIQNQWDTFIKQFTSYIPTFDPHFYSDKIQNDFRREISTNFFSNLVSYYQKLIERTKWKNRKVSERLNSEYTFPKYTNEFNAYMKSSTSFLQECNQAIFSLQTPEIDPKYIELALRYEMLKYNENFAIMNLYQIFKHFPLIRRREILSIASNRFILDAENEMNEDLLPKLITDSDSLIAELKRLSGHLDIKFDIESHDGQLFSYHCEKLYAKLSEITFTIENTTDDIPMVSDPTLLDRLNQSFLKEITIDPSINSSFDILFSTSNKKMTELMSKFSFHAQKSLSVDKVTCLLRLQYSRNKTLFQSIINSLQTLSKFREEIIQLNQEEAREKQKTKEKESKQEEAKAPTQIPVKSPDQVDQNSNPNEPNSKILTEEELQKLNQKKSRSNKNFIKKNKKKAQEPKKELTFFEMQFSIFKKEILAASSLIKSSSSSILDNESLLEMLLELFDKYYKQKLLIIHSLIEINRNLPPLYLIEDNVPSNFRFNVKAVAFRFMEMRPNILSGAHNSCLTPIRLSLSILENMSTALRTLINFQIFAHNFFMNANKDLFPYFECPDINTPYQTSSEEFPYSFCHFYFCLSRIPDFFAISFRIASEICSSFTAKALKLESYFLFATWEQLLQETKKLFISFQPESFHFNMDISDMVSQIMTSRYLNDLHFIHEQIEKQENDKKLKYVIKIREMVNLANMLRTFLIQTDSLYPIFKRQANLISKTDIKGVIDLAYGNYDFSTINDQWEPDELIKIVKSQQNFYLSLLIAVRFNNFADDALFIRDFFQIGIHGTGFNSRPTRAMHKHQQILRNMPNMIFYEPDLFKLEEVTSVFCDISQITKELVSNTEYIIQMYMPYCLKTEIAFLCGYERNFLKHYSSTDVFILNATPEINSILSKDNKLNFLYVPTHFQCLSIANNSIEDLHQVLRFVSIRLQINEWIRHDSHINQTKAKTLENIYSENLLFQSTFFSRLNIDINKDPQVGEINFTVKYFDTERVIYVCKQILTALSLYESVISPEEQSATFITTSSTQSITYTLESVISYINDLITPPRGRPTFLTPSLYFQKCMEQFWYQCNDQFRSDFSAALSSTEKKIDDSIIGFQDSRYQINAYKYSLDWLRLSLLKLGYYYLNETHDPKVVSFRSALNNLDQKSYANGRKLYEQNVNIKSTARIGGRPKIGTIETALMKEKTTLLLTVMEALFQTEMERIICENYDHQIATIDEAFSAPNQALKPDCYSKVMRISSILTNYLPTISSINEQFSQEYGFALSRFCHALYRTITVNGKQLGKNEDDNIIIGISLNEIDGELKEISALLTNFLSAAKKQLFKTWNGYHLNALRENSSHSELQIFLNMYIKLFKSNYNNTINFKLATRLQTMLNTLASLRDTEKRMNHEQVKFEKRITNEIKEEFELLLRDLGDEIRKAQLKLVETKNKVYNHAFTAINRFKDDPKFIENTTEKDSSYAKQLLSAPIEIRDPDLRTLIRVQVQQRKQARAQRRKLKQIHREARRQKREAKKQRLNANQSPSQTPIGQAPIGESANQEGVDIENTNLESNQEIPENHENEEIQVNQNEEEDQESNLDAFPKMVNQNNQINENQEDQTNDNSDNQDLDEEYSSSSEPNSDDDDFDDEGRKKRKEKNIPLEMEKIKAEIEQLQIERKKLRIYNTLSSIGFIKIYSRMIEKVAEEKKNYSAKLLENHRLFEVEMSKIDEELYGAYNALTSVEIDMETVRNDIEEGKKITTKLAHWKELNLRKSGDIQKEVKRLLSESSNPGNVNVTKLLQKISEKQNELEMLNYENEQFDEEIYYEVREPMMQLDQMRREITRRRARQAEQIQQQQYELQQQLELQPEELEQQLQQNLQEQLEEEEQEGQELEMKANSRISFTLPKSPRSPRTPRANSGRLNQNQTPTSSSSPRRRTGFEEEEEEADFIEDELTCSRATSSREFSQIQSILKENDLLKTKNDLIKKQIKELEAQIKAMPKTTAIPQLKEALPAKQLAPAFARPKSTRQSKKTIVRPRNSSRSFSGSNRPKTST